MDSTEAPAKETTGKPPELPVDLRDWFAGQALIGLMAQDDLVQLAQSLMDSLADDTKTVRSLLSAKAYEFADAMLAARSALTTASAAKKEAV